MLTILFYIVLALLVITTLFVVMRPLLFSLRQHAIEPAEGVSLDAQIVAEHLAAAVRCRTIPLDDKGTPDPEAFTQLHKMLADTYPLAHSKLKREIINGYSRPAMRSSRSASSGTTATTWLRCSSVWW
jgi:carboxypeptidase PM20D1